MKQYSSEVCRLDNRNNLKASTNKLPSLTKMTMWHAHTVHMAKHRNMVGALGPLNPALGLFLSQHDPCMWFSRHP